MTTIHAETYTVSTWDGEEGEWQPEFTGLKKWEVRTALRELYRCGWTQMSMQVKAETHDRPAARFERTGNHAFVARTDAPKSVRRSLVNGA